jgi:hypothetical protein
MKRFREACGASERFEDVAEKLRQARPFPADPRIFIPATRRRSAWAADARRESCRGPVIEFVSGEGGGQPANSDGFALNPEPRIISVRFGEPRLTPVRDVISRSRSCPTGKYPSWKMRRMMQWESPGELKAFRLLDCDAKIRRFVEQPCEIVYIIGGESRRHYPDIYVEYDHEKQLWEVKDDSRASEADLLARTKLLTEGLKPHGFAYRLVLDSEVRKQPRLQNASILLSHGRGSIEEIDRERVRLKLQSSGSLSWGGACAGEYGPNGKQLLCRLTLDGVLTIDMDQPLSANSLFRVAEGVR